METSFMVYDYPEQNEKETKTIKGRVCFVYKYELEVPKEWGKEEIINDMWENKQDYMQDLDDIDYE